MPSMRAPDRVVHGVLSQAHLHQVTHAALLMDSQGRPSPNACRVPVPLLHNRTQAEPHRPASTHGQASPCVFRRAASWRLTALKGLL